MIKVHVGKFTPYMCWPYDITHNLWAIALPNGTDLVWRNLSFDWSDLNKVFEILLGQRQLF